MAYLGTFTEVGTVDTASIADDAVTADKLANTINTDIATGVTAGTTASAALPKAGGTMTGDLSLGDGDNIKLGAGDDLQIYHDGSNSYIKESGSGNIKILGENVQFMNKDGNSNRLYIDNANGVTLYHQGGTKLQTTSTGINVTGSVTLSGDSENKLYNASTSPATSTVTNTSVLYGRQIDLYALDDVVLRSGTSGSDDILFLAGGSERARIKGSGNVGIGQSNPTAPLSFGKSVYGQPDDEDFYRIKIQDQGGIHNDVGIGQTVSGNMVFNWTPNTYLGFNAGTNGELMRIDSSGRVTMPNQPAFYSYKNGSYNETSGVNTVTSWTSELDVGSNFSSSTGRFTAPVSGNYLFSFNAMAGQTSGDVQYRIYKNNANYAGSNSIAEGGNWRQTCVTAIIPLSQNDYVTFVCYSSSTSTTQQVYSGRYSHISGHLIG